MYTFTISNTTFFCCRAKDRGGWYSFSAAFTNGIITDTVNWVCTNNTTTTGPVWAQNEFDDSAWTPAMSRGPAYSVGCGSEMIWYENHVVNEWIYCRYKGQ